MRNVQAFLEAYKAKEFKVNGDKLNQLERNQFKADFNQALMADLAEAGLQVAKVDGGNAVLVENDQLGAVAVVVDGVVKNLDYNVDFEAELQAEKDAERAERLAKQEAKRQEKANG